MAKVTVKVLMAALRAAKVRTGDLTVAVDFDGDEECFVLSWNNGASAASGFDSMEEVVSALDLLGPQKAGGGQ